MLYHRPLSTIAALVSSLAVLTAFAGSAQAQEVVVGGSAGGSTSGSASGSASGSLSGSFGGSFGGTSQAGQAANGGGRQQTLKAITERVSKETGLRVLADSNLGRQQVLMSETAATPETLEDYLTRLTRRLPNGSVWLKIYLPASTELRADAVAEMARAQVSLLGRPAPNTVQIQGKILTAAEADPIIKTLGLQPVYVLTSKTGAPVLGSNVLAATGFAGGGTSSPVMEALMKQLGVSNVKDIPSGNYQVKLPGPDGTPMDATVNVENGDGTMKIGIRMGDIKAN
jgi:hypothetical protein